VIEQCGPFVSVQAGDPTASIADQDAIRELFPDTYGLPVVTFGIGEQADLPAINVGVILSGGQAPGGHNVIAGLYDGLKAMNPDSQLFGFLGGPSGLLEDEYLLLSDEVVDAYRNTGGFDMICSGRTKLETTEQFDAVAATCKRHDISALVVIGGDDSNTNACVLAQYMITTGAGIQVIGCPKTIDGDLKSEWVEVSFGFDTATKVYSELIGNILRDANSARKYWHFIKLMGRSASHIALECALQTHPTACIISEEVAAKQTTLKDIVLDIATMVRDRADSGMNFGIVLIPEGLIEFIPEMKKLIGELNELLAANKEYFEGLRNDDDKLQFVNSEISQSSSQAFSSLPLSIQLQLISDRDPHGNVQVSKIETEKLLIDMVDDLLQKWNAARASENRKRGAVRQEKPIKFSAQAHFFGYEGRCAAPSNFDADYCYSLGYTASALIGAGKTGYMASVRNVAADSSAWQAGGIPLTMMMNLERRHGEDKPVIRKALVDLEGRPFQEFASARAEWVKGNDFVYPGPIQYFGPSSVCDRTTLTLALEQKG
jgi:pyrophosphate--fructose-6-phosphate 1-phosphotransferase